MIKYGCIYTVNQKVEIIVNIFENAVAVYELKTFQTIQSKDYIDELLVKFLKIAGINKSHFKFYDRIEFEKNIDGYLGEINPCIFDCLQSYFHSRFDVSNDKECVS